MDPACGTDIQASKRNIWTNADQGRSTNDRLEIGADVRRTVFGGCAGRRRVLERSENQILRTKAQSEQGVSEDGFRDHVGARTSLRQPLDGQRTVLGAHLGS